MEIKLPSGFRDGHMHVTNITSENNIQMAILLEFHTIYPHTCGNMWKVIKDESEKYSVVIDNTEMSLERLCVMKPHKCHSPSIKKFLEITDKDEMKKYFELKENLCRSLSSAISHNDYNMFNILIHLNDGNVSEYDHIPFKSAIKANRYDIVESMKNSGMRISRKFADFVIQNRPEGLIPGIGNAIKSGVLNSLIE